MLNYSAIAAMMIADEAPHVEEYVSCAIEQLADGTYASCATLGCDDYDEMWVPERKSYCFATDNVVAYAAYDKKTGQMTILPTPNA